MAIPNIAYLFIVNIVDNGFVYIGKKSVSEKLSTYAAETKEKKLKLILKLKLTEPKGRKCVLPDRIHNELCFGRFLATQLTT